MSLSKIFDTSLTIFLFLLTPPINEASPINSLPFTRFDTMLKAIPSQRPVAIASLEYPSACE